MRAGRLPLAGLILVGYVAAARAENEAVGAGAVAASRTPVRVGPTTVTVIDERESVDDVISRVREMRAAERRERAPREMRAAERRERAPREMRADGEDRPRPGTAAFHPKEAPDRFRGREQELRQRERVAPRARERINERRKEAHRRAVERARSESTPHRRTAR